MKKQVIILILGLLFIFQACNQTQTSQTSTIDLSLRLPIPVVDGSFAPLYIGIDKGIFEKYGIKLKLEPGSPEFNPVKMIEAGKDQIGIVGGPEMIMSAREKNVKISAFALLHKNSNFVVLLTKKNSPIKIIKDLQNKRVGFFYGHISTDILRMLFAKENIKVDEVDVGFNYNLLLTDKLDAEWAFRTTAGINLPAKGVEINMISPFDYGLVTHGHTYFASENFMKQHPDYIQKFLTAFIESIEYSLAHRDEAVQSVLKRDQNINEEIVIKQLEIYEQTIRNNDKIGWIDLNAMEITKKDLKENQILKTDLDLTSAFNLDFLNEYYKTQNK